MRQHGLARCAFLLGMMLDLAGSATAACDGTTPQGTWFLRGASETRDNHDRFTACAATAVAEFAPAGVFRISRYERRCEIGNPERELPPGSQFTGTYAVQTSCSGRWDADGEARFQIVQGGQRLRAMQVGRLVWEGEKVDPGFWSVLYPEPAP